MKKTIKYYVEFTDDNLGITNNYVMQSKWFDTEEEARKWFTNLSRDLDFNQLKVSLMKAEWDEDEYFDIYQVEVLHNVY